MKKKKNHLKNLALLGIASGLMIATQGQAEISQNQSESYMASNRSYYGPSGYRRGNYVNSTNGNNTNYGQPTAESSWTPPSHNGQAPGQPPVQSCQGSGACAGQQPSSSFHSPGSWSGQQPSSGCAGHSGCPGQPPVSSCQNHSGCAGQPPVQSCQGSHGCPGQGQGQVVHGRDIMPPPPVQVGTTSTTRPTPPSQPWNQR